MITIDSDYIRGRKDEFDKKTTDIHLIDGKQYPFATVMQIYDNKVSYITVNPQKMVSIIIEDKHITQMHRTIFEYMWQKTQSLFAENKNKPTSAYQIPENIS
jgi:hypothetical protein